MTQFLRAHWRRFLFLPPLAAAILVLVVARQSNDGPQRPPPAEQPRPARVVEVLSLDVVPRVIGYGSVRPTRDWDAVAEVPGRVEHVHPDLLSGAILPKGTELVRIERESYDLTLARIAAQLTRLDQEAANTRRSLAIERRTLETLERDLDRKRRLAARGNAAQATVDEAERAVLQGRQQVQSLENQLALIPAQRAELEAQRDEAARDLQRTVITTPFAVRVGAVDVEVGQYVSRGQVLAHTDAIDVAEVAAQVPLDRMWMLLRGAPASGTAPLRLSDETREDLPDLLGIEPVVRLRAGDFTAEWDGRLARIAETIDPATRTVGVIVEVDDPYGQARVGERPPLTRNMFVEVELRGRPVRHALVVPREAVRGGTLWIADADNRLRRRAVSVVFAQGNFAVIEGIEAGARVVVSDLVPMVEGMLLDPQPDGALRTALVEQARAEVPLR